LRPLDASAEQDYDGLAVATEIDTKSTPGVLPQLEEPTPKRHAVAEQSGLEPSNAHPQPCLHSPVIE
jgi:hypothetical protein